MTQKDYTKALQMNLKGIDNEYKEEILENINEHFEVGLSKGKSEEEIAKALGDPKTQARLFILERSIENIKSGKVTGSYFHVATSFLSLGTAGLLSGIAALFTLAFWLMFMILGIALIISGVVLLLSAGVKFASEKPLVTVLSIFTAAGISCFGALASIWIFNFSRAITGVFLRLAGNLRSKYKLIRNEVD